MDYRDERNALRGRVENLEQELGEAKRALDAQQDGDWAARVAQLATDLAEALGALQEARRDLLQVTSTQEAQPAADVPSVAHGAESEVVGHGVVWMLMAGIGLLMSFFAATLWLGGVSYEGQDEPIEITRKAVEPWGALGLLVAIVGAVGAVRARCVAHPVSSGGPDSP